MPPKPRETPAKPRLDAKAWIDAALDALVETGVSGVAVEPLSRRLKVTKGSFYWHFADRDSLLLATVERWAAGTEAIIAHVRAVPDPQARLVSLLRLAHRSGRDRRMARAMGRLSEHERAGPAVRRVVQLRARFLTECFEAQGLSAAAAERAGRLLHASYVGMDELDEFAAGFRSQRERILALSALARLLAQAP